MYMMWPSTDAELKEEETHLLIFFGIFYCSFAFFIWFFCCPCHCVSPTTTNPAPIIKKGGDCLTPLQWL